MHIKQKQFSSYQEERLKGMLCHEYTLKSAALQYTTKTETLEQSQSVTERQKSPEVGAHTHPESGDCSDLPQADPRKWSIKMAGQGRRTAVS